MRSNEAGCEGSVDLTLKIGKISNNRHSCKTTLALHGQESQLFCDISRNSVKLTLRLNVKYGIPT